MAIDNHLGAIVLTPAADGADPIVEIKKRPVLRESFLKVDESIKNNEKKEGLIKNADLKFGYEVLASFVVSLALGPHDHVTLGLVDILRKEQFEDTHISNMALDTWDLYQNNAFSFGSLLEIFKEGAITSIINVVSNRSIEGHVFA